MTFDFTPRPAVRCRQPIFAIITGERKQGKTYSALRIASGIREVTGQRIVLADTEHPRGLAYGDTFEYEYVDLGHDEYSPERHIALLGAFADAILVIDSWSDFREGPGGDLDIHARIVAGDQRDAKPGRKSMEAWRATKTTRTNPARRAIKTHPGPLIACVRAKAPSDLGNKVWTGIVDNKDIGAASFTFFVESQGHIQWNRRDVSPGLCDVPDGLPRAAFPKQLDETVGRMLAKWADGEMITHPLVDTLSEVSTDEELQAAHEAIAKIYEDIDQYSQRQIQVAYKAARARVTGGT